MGFPVQSGTLQIALLLADIITLYHGRDGALAHQLRHRGALQFGAQWPYPGHCAAWEPQRQAAEQYCQFGRRRFHSGQADGAVWEASGSNLMQDGPVIPDTLNLKSMGPFSLVGLNGRARPPGGHWAFAINELCHLPHGTERRLRPRSLPIYAGVTSSS
jgi:hypothetical protein